MSKATPETTKPETPAETPEAPADAAPAANEAQSTPETEGSSSAPAKFDPSTIVSEDSQEIKTLDAPPPDNVAGLDAEGARQNPPKRGRGRPPKNGEAKPRDYAKENEARRAREAARRAGINIDEPKGAASIPAAPQPSTDAIVGAALVMQSLDFFRTVISNGEVDKDITPDEAASRVTVRAATNDAWVQYLDSQGAKLPPWALVTITSITYVAPALKTPIAREKLGFAWVRLKEWIGKKWRRE